MNIRLCCVISIILTLAACGTPQTALQPEEISTSTLPSAADTSSPTPFLGHTGNVFTAAFSPDGTLIASASGDGTVILWDLAARQPVALLQDGDSFPMLQFTFSPDGKWLTYVSENRVGQWDVSKALQADLTPLNHSWKSEINLWHAGSAAFSPDGKWLASYHGDSLNSGGEGILLRDLSTLPAGKAPVMIGDLQTGYDNRSLAFSPDSKILAAGDDFGVTLWDVATGERTAELDNPQEGRVTGLAFSPDGTLLAAGVEPIPYANSYVFLWDLATRQTIGQPLRGINSMVDHLVFSPDGKLFVLIGQYDIHIWEVSDVLSAAQDSQQVDPIKNLKGEDLAFSPDNKWMGSCSGNDVLLWDAVTLQPIEQAFASATPTPLPLSPGKAAFVGEYTSTPLDEDQDGQFEALLVTAMVEIEEPQVGYSVGGYLSTADGEDIMPAVPNILSDREVAFRIPPGEGGLVKADLKFSGEWIRSRNLDGPYQINFIMTGNGGLFVDTASFTTTAYKADQFGEYEARIRSVTDCGVDQDEDGIFEALVVSVTVEAYQPGTYQVQGMLYSNEQTISWAYGSDTLKVGKGEIEIRFDGKEINKAGLAAPYTVRLILSGSDYGQLGNSEDFPISTSLTANQFSRKPVLLTGKYKDYGTDTDDDGLFDYLTLEIGVEVNEAGEYTFEAYLMSSGPRYETDITRSELTVSLLPGAQEVSLNFSGVDINDSRVDGPYTVLWVKIIDRTVDDWPIIDRSSQEPAHTTGEYYYEDFTHY